MERPRLRPLEAFPIDREGQRHLGLRDPSGLSEAVATLAPAAIAVIELLDGETTRDELCQLFERRHRRPLERSVLDALLDQLDQALFLDSTRFRRHAEATLSAFARAPDRPPYLAGRSYPADAVALTALLDAAFDAPLGPGPIRPRTTSLPRALVAPHIDFRRGGPAYAWAYRALADSAESPELVVIFGTDHLGSAHPFLPTRKHHDTPLGRIETDLALVDAIEARVRARLGAAAAADLWRDEHHHRSEHSIEFQMVWLRHVLGARADALRALPILCGSFHPYVDGDGDPVTSERVAVFVEAVRELCAGRRTLFIAGADLAHVGPRFGDPQALDAEDRAALEHRDRQTLGAALRGEAAAWFEEIRSERDRRRVCGLPPIWALLEAARPSAGWLAAYAQCPADEQAGSIVTVASLIFPS